MSRELGGAVDHSKKVSGSNANGFFEQTYDKNGELVKVIQYRHGFILTGGNATVNFPIAFPDLNYTTVPVMAASSSFSVTTAAARTISSQNMNSRINSNNAIAQTTISYEAIWIKV
jgi:hypothetical protein